MDLIGRQPELDALNQFLATPCVVALWGPPGVGKSALAWKVSRLWTQGGNNSCFCDLSAATDDKEIYRCLGQSLEIFLLKEGGLSTAEQIGHALSNREQILVVLDNAEHLVKELASCIVIWRRIAPNVRFLVTSRELTRIPRELQLELRPLSVPENGASEEEIGRSTACQLFSSIARTTHASADDGELQPTIAAIARRLDGVPLAIELAAGQLDLMSIQQLHDRLQESYAVLTGGTRNRQDTLETAIAWSWDLLSGDEQVALTECCVFAGRFDLDAAEAVLSGKHVPALLQALRRKSLLAATPSSGPAARSLQVFQSVRMFAAKQGPTQECLQSHAQHFVQRAEKLTIHEAAGEERMRALEQLVPDLKAIIERASASKGDPQWSDFAARSCIALDPYLEFRGPVLQRVDILQRCLALPALSPRLIGKLHLMKGKALRALGDVEGSLADFEAAIDLARQSGDSKLEAEAYGKKGGSLTDLRRLDEARVAFDAAYRDAETAPEIMQWDSGLAFLQGETRRAIELAEAALAAADAREDLEAAASILPNLVIFHAAAGNLEQYQQAYERGLAAARKLNHQKHESLLLLNHGASLRQSGRFREARDELELALAVSSRIGCLRYQSLALANLGLLDLLDGVVERARQRLQRAVSQLEGNMLNWSAALLQGALAVAELWNGDQEAARQRFSTIDELLEGVGQQSVRSTVRLYRAQLELAELAQESKDSTFKPVAQPGFALLLQEVSQSKDDQRLNEVAGAVQLLRKGVSRLGISQEELGAELWQALGQVSLRVDSEGRWFELIPNPRVDVSRRKAPRKILALLADTAMQSPGGQVQADALIACGWPNEDILAHAAKNRLHVAISTLRSFGLGEHLAHDEVGYFLSPEINLEIVRS